MDKSIQTTLVFLKITTILGQGALDVDDLFQLRATNTNKNSCLLSSEVYEYVCAPLYGRELPSPIIRSIQMRIRAIDALYHTSLLSRPTRMALLLNLNPHAAASAAILSRVTDMSCTRRSLYIA